MVSYNMAHVLSLIWSIIYQVVAIVGYGVWRPQGSYIRATSAMGSSAVVARRRSRCAQALQRTQTEIVPRRSQYLRGQYGIHWATEAITKTWFLSLESIVAI